MTEGGPNNQSGNQAQDQTQAWWRIAPMVFFALIAYFVLWLLFIGAFLQFISMVAQGERTPQITVFNRRIRLYLIEIFDYLVYNHDIMPFPFADFPSTDSAERPATPVASPEAPATPASPAEEPAPAPRAKPAATAKTTTAKSTVTKTAGTADAATPGAKPAAAKPTRKRTTTTRTATAGTGAKTATSRKPATARKTTTSTTKRASTRTAKPADAPATPVNDDGKPES